MDSNLNLSKDISKKSDDNSIKNAGLQQDQFHIQEQGNDQAFRERLYGKWADESAQLKNTVPGLQFNTGNKPGEFTSLLSAGLSTTFLASLEELEEDGNRASKRFFELVKAKARCLVMYSMDDESCANNLAQLLSAVLYYLEERPSHFYSPQRNRRRATCKRIVEEISKFLPDAPAVYAEKIKGVMQSKRKNGRLSGRWQRFQEKNAFELQPHIIDEKKAKDALLSEPLAAELRKHTFVLDSLIGENMPKNPSPRAVAEALKTYRDRLSKEGFAIVMEYSKLLKCCDDLIAQNPEEKY